MLLGDCGGAPGLYRWNWKRVIRRPVTSVGGIAAAALGMGAAAYRPGERGRGELRRARLRAVPVATDPDALLMV